MRTYNKLGSKSRASAPVPPERVARAVEDSAASLRILEKNLFRSDVPVGIGILMGILKIELQRLCSGLPIRPGTILRAVGCLARPHRQLDATESPAGIPGEPDRLVVKGTAPQIATDEPELAEVVAEIA